VQRADESKKEQYVKRLCEEIELFAEKIGEVGEIPVADTVYFGGGTPTLLSAKQFGRILDTVNAKFGIEEDVEITAETNPKSADGEKLAEIRKTGINRLSIGMQSVHDCELKALGRIHNFEDFKTTFADARDAGFDNISVDLMYGIPQQTRESFAESVETLASFAPEHISSYCLTVEEGTNFGRRRESLILPDEDAVSDMYSDMTEILSKFGYSKYEISNFAKVGRASRHNL
jgi:oxygen-independent coproporphyrinogen-3 oxidase